MSLAEVRPAEVCRNEVRTAEARTVEVRPVEFRLVEVRTVEVSPAEFRSRQIGPDRRVLVTPLVPGVHALPEDRDVLVIRHGSTPAWIQPHSSSASRFTAGASGFLNFSQSGDRPER
jgi:hypothetical protein